MSSWGRSRLLGRGLFIAVVVLVCVAIGVPALAYTSRSTHTYVIRSGKGPAFGSSTATCPTGQHVLFGGFSNGVAGMRRTASNRLTVDGYNLGGQPLWLTSFAYCGHGPVSTKDDVAKFRADLETMRNRLAGMIKSGTSKSDLLKTLEDDYGWRSTGCPLTPPTPSCLQFQQIDSLIAELK